MTNSERKQVAEMLVAMSENFGESISPARAKLILTALAPYSLGDVRRGLMHVLRSRVYRSMPTLAEMLEAIEGGDEELRVMADTQWNRLLAASSYESLRGKLDPIALHCYRSLGADRTTWTHHDLQFLHKRWVEQYVRTARQPHLVEWEGDRERLPARVKRRLEALTASLSLPAPGRQDA